MSVSFDHRDPGSAEADWLAAAPWADAPGLDISIDRLVIVAAHPDDETLGAGGLIATAAASAVDVSVIVATDGEASHPALPELGARRRLEVAEALRELAPRARLRFLGLPDGGLRESAAALRGALERELGPMPFGVLLVVPWWGDGHRDHRVAGEAALALSGPGVHVVGYPIWMWHWADPHDVDAVVEPERWRMLPLSEDALAAKAAAVSRHTSQVSAISGAEGDEPILHGGMLAHFARPFELFVDAELRAPDSVGRWTFEDIFRRHDNPWGFETSWYEQRKRAVLIAALERARYAQVLELGCATGALTIDLAARADSVLGVDVSAVALERAGHRAAAALAGGEMRFDQLTLPGEWPVGRFDLVVLSELGYYWSRADLDIARARIAQSLTADGHLVACHWRHPIPDAPLTGDEVHAVLDSDPAWTRSVRHLERDFVLDVYRRGEPAALAGDEGAR